MFVCMCARVQDRFQDIEGGMEVLLLAPLALAVPVCACACVRALGPHVSMMKARARVFRARVDVACVCARALT